MLFRDESGVIFHSFLVCLKCLDPWGNRNHASNLLRCKWIRSKTNQRPSLIFFWQRKLTFRASSSQLSLTTKINNMTHWVKRPRSYPHQRPVKKTVRKSEFPFCFIFLLWSYHLEIVLPRDFFEDVPKKPCKSNRSDKNQRLTCETKVGFKHQRNSHWQSNDVVAEENYDSTKGLSPTSTHNSYSTTLWHKRKIAFCWMPSKHTCSTLCRNVSDCQSIRQNYFCSSFSALTLSLSLSLSFSLFLSFFLSLFFSLISPAPDLPQILRRAERWPGLASSRWCNQRPHGHSWIAGEFVSWAGNSCLRAQWRWRLKVNEIVQEWAEQILPNCCTELFENLCSKSHADWSTHLSSRVTLCRS